MNTLKRSSQYIVISEHTGTNYKFRQFCDCFGRVRAAVVKEIPAAANLWFMDLRRTLVVWLGEEGATETQIAAVTGHQIETRRAILETYLPRNETMAAAAIDKITARRARLRHQAAQAGAAEAERHVTLNPTRVPSPVPRHDTVVVPLRFAPANDAAPPHGPHTAFAPAE